MTTLATLQHPKQLPRQHPSTAMAPKPRREFLAPLKSLVRSLSGNNLAAKNKKHEKPVAVPSPQRPPEKLVKDRPRQRASSFWSKKVCPTDVTRVYIHAQLSSYDACAAYSTLLRRHPGPSLLFS